ncbi:MAG TPA: ATP-dependent 6-phosphofructokinase [Planctomycetota bacterium]|nr:ATP-dependent 6-phosphofructokinase [Planctomycetota bacterium]
MTTPTKTIALMTGGGDAPGLNAVIRAVVKRGVSVLGWRVLGLENSFDGLFTTPPGVRELGRDDVRGILRRGGTILGTTNSGDPFDYKDDHGARSDVSAEVVKGLAALGCEGLIAVGGDGTQAICARLAERHGLKVVGVPKTIDNDIKATEATFGFDTAVAYATDAVDRLHTTAEAHDRVMVVEVMGRHAGWIALASGLAGGADAVLIPEIPFRFEAIEAKVTRRRIRRRGFSIIVVAEGAAPVGGAALTQSVSGGASTTLGGVGRFVAEELARRTGVDTRYTVLGHLLRGGTPTAYDRILATRFGHHAVELARTGRWGRMVALRDGRISDAPLSEVVQGCRTIDPDCDLVQAARGVGIVFGDEPVDDVRM